MKQGIVAFLVVLAGCFGVFSILGLGDPQLREESRPAKTVSVKLSPGQAQKSGLKLPLVSKATVTASNKSDRVAPVETAAISVTKTRALEPETSPVFVEPVKPEPSPTFLAGVARLAERDSIEAIEFRDQLEPGSAEWKTLTWAIAISGQRAVPSKMISETREVLKDWPGQKELQANFEEALFRESPSSNLIVTAYDKALPSTPDGSMALARAALETGEQAKAASVLRALWSSQRMDEAEEDKFIKEFGALFTAADHKRRMEFLLYRERYDQARRFSELGEAKSLYEAFSAVGRKAKNADQKIKAVDAKWQREAILLYINIKRHRQLREFEAAARLLEKTPADPDALVDTGAWWVEARIVGRGLMDEGKAKAAYRLARAHVAKEPDDIAEAEFHAGWFALRGMRDNALAEAHFKSLLRASLKAHDQSRGHYWLGIALEKSNKPAAKAHFMKATDYPATFYGQLAAARLKVDIRPGHRYAVTDSDRLAFAARPEIIGLSLLEQANEPSRARRLYLALAASLENPVDVQLLATKALETHGSTLALAIGKTALKQGHDPGLAAFPLGAIPDTADVSGAGKALAYAIARQESAFNPQAVSPANARGLLQLLPSTARRVAKQYQLAYADEKLTEDPAFNATLGAHYLGEQINKFDGSLIMTFAAYNAGPSRVTQWIGRYGDPRGKGIDAAVDWVESIPFTETRDYVQRVMENYQVYKLLLNERPDIAADMTAAR